MDEDGNNVVAGVMLVVTGAILGAAAALLFAPQSGRETRRDIGKYARKTCRKIEGAAGEFAESVTGMAEAVEEKAEELLDQGKDLARESRDAVFKALDEGQERLVRQRDRLAKLLG